MRLLSKLEPNIPHTIFGDSAARYHNYRNKAEEFLFPGFHTAFQDRIDPVPARSYLHNQLSELQNHYSHD